MRCGFAPHNNWLSYLPKPISQYVLVIHFSLIIGSNSTLICITPGRMRLLFRHAPPSIICLWGLHRVYINFWLFNLPALPLARLWKLKSWVKVLIVLTYTPFFYLTSSISSWTIGYQGIDPWIFVYRGIVHNTLPLRYKPVRCGLWIETHYLFYKIRTCCNSFAKHRIGGKHLQLNPNWASRIRTNECSSQSAVPYRLAIAQFHNQNNFHYLRICRNF